MRATSKPPPAPAERWRTKEGERAKKLENPTVRAPIENMARRCAELAEKFEAARKRRI